MAEARLFAMPVMGRYGLTHGILSWARCRLWCEQNGATMVAPFWLKLRVGPYLRRERDKRNYFMLFQSGNAVASIRRLALLARANRIEIGPEWPDPPPQTERTHLLRFHNAAAANDRKSFHQVLGHGPFLRRELLQITRRRFHPPIQPEPFVAIHVRMGDFLPTPADGQIAAGTNNMRLPVDWYGDRLDALRKGLGNDLRAIVYSDGEDADLAPLLSRKNVVRAPKRQSVTDLLEMGLGVAVIASGSGFSLWGAFLGSAPRLSFPGQAKVPIAEDRTRDIESADGDAIGDSFLVHVRKRIGGGA